MKQSKSLIKTLRQAPKSAQAVSHKFLIKAGFIDKQLLAGIYSFLPLGWRVMQKIANIIRDEMNNIGGQEVFLPTLQSKKLWKETKRWDEIDPPLFKVKDRHNKTLALGSTHEEVLTDIVRRSINSYKDFPLYIYQIQNKFRNEMRATGGLLRVREFLMKDLYSFHTSSADLKKYYEKVLKSYEKIFDLCGLKTKIVQAAGGTIGGDITHEFQMICATGEDKLLICTKCNWAVNLETQKQKLKTCPNCNALVELAKGIENGHIFQLGTKYSKSMKAYYTDAQGKKQLIHMGCYGIGLGRLMATIVEAHHDKSGILWPKQVSPFDIHLISLVNAEEIYKDLIKNNINVLYDDRDETAGVKFQDADLIGIPIRIVVSEKTLKQDSVEIKNRNSKKIELIKIKDLIKKLN